MRDNGTPTRRPLLDGVHSLLFVPASEPARMEKAWAAEAHAVIADLEDAVAEDAKAGARRHLAAQLRRPREHGLVIVRINPLASEHARLDLEVIAGADVDALVVPKAEPADLAGVDVPVPPVIALVETARGLREAYASASTPGVAALMVGPVDLGLRLGPEQRELLFARSSLVVDSAAAGLAPPIDGPCLSLRDTAVLRGETERSRALGFGSKACIHPAQLPVVHDVFAPSEPEVTWARSVVDAAARATEAGRGAFRLDGEMVDAPVVARARRVLADAATRTSG
jgi:citrate lyase subunit beta/citryl-CoA lyase